MKIVFCAAEAAPYAKVGGLGDVVGSLPKALRALGEEIIVCIPHYGSIMPEEYPLVETGIEIQVPDQGADHTFRVLEGTLFESPVKIYAFANHNLFGQYGAVYPHLAHVEEARRYEVFGEGVFRFLKKIAFEPDILHLHDWHTAIMAYLLKHRHKDDPFYSKTVAVITIHNMAYQGEINGVNWLKEGILCSDAVVAVSPTYAREILSDDKGGAGLASVVLESQNKLSGILNGIDTDLFNPESDKFIPQNYDINTFQTGKAVCKGVLQAEIGLPQEPDTPVFAMVSRLVEQKGLDILLPLMKTLSQLPAQFVILGSGESHYEEALREFNRQTTNIRSMIGYNVALGQKIYAGSDLFLMPSRFEPCGLGQMIAFRYGSVPVVRQTGGLADTVFDVDANPAMGNGFVFEPYSSEALLAAIHRALAVWANRPQVWPDIVRNGMSQDLSWVRSARDYRDVYRKTVERLVQKV